MLILFLILSAFSFSRGNSKLDWGILKVELFAAVEQVGEKYRDVQKTISWLVSRKRKTCRNSAKRR